ncbi:MAG: hypothetical protein EBU33_07575 [Sphingobacteriia bacterium]|nr:hypothetical protein [Sphingobacteriia bacterium]
MANQKKAGTGKVENEQGLFGKIEAWTNKNERRLFFSLVICTILLTFISFNARISEAHDDALYLEGGWRFVSEFPNYFYTQNAPLYPLVLALLIKILGFNLIIFNIIR